MQPPPFLAQLENRQLRSPRTLGAPRPRRAAPNRTRNLGPRRRPLRSNSRTPPQADQPKIERVTKRERVPTLLSRPEGASIEEMMQATDWRQHSVRGFLAGTVKKKLGFPLTSSKAKDGARRYHIEKQRGR